MKKIIAVLLTGIICFSLSACVTRDANKLDRAKNENSKAQREMNRVFNP
jgi:starvation-inducible outer membrane lipoprotein